MNVVGTTLKKVLVDPGSSVDVLFKDMLDTLKIDRARLKPTILLYVDLAKVAYNP